ncbi:hypothetical protein APHAL10511_007569 [Amanita phalloides]|nr:hypothetical protein APHAL10511_007569 [Amanita phalloides]
MVVGEASGKLLYTLAVGFFTYVVYRGFTSGKRAPNMPPGPPTLPFIGNLHQMPKSRLHLRFSDWAKQYGDVFSIKVLNKTIVVLNSPTLVKEIIDKHALSSSNRPQSTMNDMLIPDHMNPGTTRYAHEGWQAFRKAASQLFSNDNMKHLAPYQEAEVTQMIWEFANQREWLDAIKRFTTSFHMGIIYGTRGATLQSKHVAAFRHVHPQFMSLLDFGKAPPIDIFPFLAWVPEYFAKWKRLVGEVRSLHAELYDDLYRIVEDRIASERESGCFMEQMILKADSMGLNSRSQLLNLAAVLLQGSDTMLAALHTIVLVLAKYPHALKKAQEEVDRVVGLDRMPMLSDMSSLPYVNAILEECNRLHPIAPLNLPHEMVCDEVVNSVLYPKDAALFTNLYFIYRDERYFDRPDEFVPERFLKHPFGLKDNVTDDPARRPNLHFGGGRRVCPGINAAKSSLELVTSRLIWGFDVLPAIDPDTGKEVCPDLNDCSEGILVVPLSTSARVVPRSAHHKGIIGQRFAASGDVLSVYEREIEPVDQAFNAAYRDIL